MLVIVLWNRQSIGSAYTEFSTSPITILSEWRFELGMSRQNLGLCRAIVQEASFSRRLLHLVTGRLYSVFSKDWSGVGGKAQQENVRGTRFHSSGDSTFASILY